MKELLVVVDMQNDFVTGALKNAAALEIADGIKTAVLDAKKRGATVVFTRDTHGRNYLDTREGRMLPVPHCIVGTSGHEIIDELKPFADNVIDKNTFGSIDLAYYAIRGHYDSVTFVGVCTDICVISNAFTVKSCMPEAEINVIADLCAGVTKESHETALAAMRAAQINIL